MGLFDFIRGELIEVIDWVEQGKGILMHKFPDKDANLKYGAKLTVCLLYTSPSPRDRQKSRMPSSA